MHPHVRSRSSPRVPRVLHRRFHPYFRRRLCKCSSFVKMQILWIDLVLFLLCCDSYHVMLRIVVVLTWLGLTACRSVLHLLRRLIKLILDHVNSITHHPTKMHNCCWRSRLRSSSLSSRSGGSSGWSPFLGSSSPLPTGGLGFVQASGLVLTVTMAANVKTRDQNGIEPACVSSPKKLEKKIQNEIYLPNNNELPDRVPQKLQCVVF